MDVGRSIERRKLLKQAMKAVAGDKENVQEVPGQHSQIRWREFD
jgi:hypothetical protein